ncbi:hypothetical protein H4219_003294 [Mycoemilia scoparia]|uniref:Uncharacterized protein n=1 Tax=Mycoemilia scoparia TaxID=417184 RepID=A0A9W8DPF7_9FUNG|nr:hypothetical protein H4219_003294 [Mycoemilia scoparia]
MIQQSQQIYSYLEAILGFFTNTVAYIHATSFPLAQQLVTLASSSSPHIQTVTDTVGNWTVTLIVEMLVLYTLFHFSLMVVRWTSNTMYRLIKFFLMLALIIALSLTITYYYFFKTKTGREYSLEHNSFVTKMIKEQALSFFNQFVGAMSGTSKTYGSHRFNVKDEL